MSINGVNTSSMMYSYTNQVSSSQASGNSLTNIQTSHHKPMPVPPTYASNENELLASEMGVKMSIKDQDNGFTAEQLSSLSEEGSPLSELFSALAEDFENADTNGDGVIKREEAMAFAEANGINVPPPPGREPEMAAGDQGFTVEQLSALSEEDSPLSELFSALAEDFDTADTNGDGVITSDEARAYAENNDLTFDKPVSQLSEMA